MTTLTIPEASIAGHELDQGRHALGELRRTARTGDVAALRARLRADGYLYVPGFFVRDDVLAVRKEILARLAAGGALVPGSNPDDALPRPGVALATAFGRDGIELTRGNEPLRRLLYAGRMIAFYEALLGGPIRAFDYTWMRTIAPGPGTSVHTDIVFMGRGTKDLFTSWVPYGDVPYDLGGLALLEHSHEHDEIREQYGAQDVDAYCVNHGEEPPGDGEYGHANPILDDDARALRERLGGRWLTSEYAAGDLLLFGMFTAHGSLDNRTERLRLSSDSRYQLASEPIDERWVGANPPGHTQAGKRGMIC
jgi:Phytanoyl-CoA dioxygenase (PhyH)